MQQGNSAGFTKIVTLLQACGDQPADLCAASLFGHPAASSGQGSETLVVAPVRPPHKSQHYEEARLKRRHVVRAFLAHQDGIYMLDIIRAEAMVARTSLFLSNRSQAVRLPKAVAFADSVHEVTILRDGVRRIIVPANAVWDNFFEAPGTDLGERNQPPMQERDIF